MATEIERKFLVANEDWREGIYESRRIVQAYMTDVVQGDARASVRVRIDGPTANINVKSADMSMERTEYEYGIPVDDAQHMIDALCYEPVVAKTRHIVHHESHRWEIDEFEGDNNGLIIAEIELSSTTEAFSEPAWLGDEVTDDARYYNVYLIHHPFNTWA